MKGFVTVKCVSNFKRRFFLWSIIIGIFRAIMYEVKRYDKTTDKSWKQNLVLLPVFAFLYPDFVDIFSCRVLILISIAQVPPSFYHGALLVSRTPDWTSHHPFDAVPEKTTTSFFCTSCQLHLKRAPWFT